MKIIGVVHSPFKRPEEAPFQPSVSEKNESIIEIFPPYHRALKGLEKFKYVFVITFLHRIENWKEEVVSKMTGKKEGVLATRSPHRPNPIGLSLLKVKEIEGNIVIVENSDLLDGTPVLDIKPFVKKIDIPEEEK